MKETVDKYTDEGCMRLAEAILRQTARDYVALAKQANELKLKDKLTSFEKRELLNIEGRKEYIKKFYGSREFQIYSLGKLKMTPDEIVKKIEKENNL